MEEVIEQTDWLYRQLPLNMPVDTAGVYFTFFNPDQEGLMNAVRYKLMQIAGSQAPALYLRRRAEHDPLALKLGLRSAPLPPSLWDIQAQANLYNLTQREGARALLFDHMEDCLPWLAQRPLQAAKEAARFLHQLQHSVRTILCIFRHDLHTPPSLRERIKATMDNFVFEDGG